MGRWHGLKKEERVYKECDNGEVEDVCHWLLQCSAWNSLRQPLLEAMDNVEEHFSTKDRDRTALFYHMHVETITFCRSLTLCGQLGSIVINLHCSYLAIPMTCHLHFHY